MHHWLESTQRFTHDRGPPEPGANQRGEHDDHTPQRGRGARGRSGDRPRRACPRFAFTKAPAPELPSKLKAQQAAGRVDIDLVLTGTDGIAAGIEQKLWVDLKPHAGQLPKPAEVYQPAALRLNGLAQDQGLCVAWYPSGPLIEYMPDRVKTVPTSAEELLAWARQNKGKFMYARPANSGPGRVFMMGLPYVLGDKDPSDPKDGWDKTWDYLKELGQTIEY